MTLRIFVIIAAVLVLSGCGSNAGPAMANCTKYFFAQATIDSPDNDWNDWAIQSCQALMEDVGEEEFIDMWT